MSESHRINPLLVKALTIGALTLLLLMPLHSVESLVAERSALRDSAVQRVAAGVGRAQTVGALILTLPVIRTWSEEGKVRESTVAYHVLAHTLEVTGSVTTEVRHSGMYEVPTFRATLHLQGSIADDLPPEALAAETGVAKRVGQPTLFLAIADPAGIRELEGIRVGDTVLPVIPANEAGFSGVQADLPGWGLAAAQHLDFSIELALAGTERLQFLPWAKTVHVQLSSPWSSPSFSGAFSPETRPEVHPQGFAVEWRVLQINRGYPQAWSAENIKPEQMRQSAFGVDFYQPVDGYQRDYRAIHYAVLFIALSFMALFLWEHTFGKRVHAIQYGLIGAALSVFYLVLVAVSEHLSFGVSYALASGAMTALLSTYFGGFMRSRGAGIVVGAITGGSYSLLYLLVLSEDYALLLGALVVFAVLAFIILGTRKLDWFSVAK